MDFELEGKAIELPARMPGRNLSLLTCRFEGDVVDEALVAHSAGDAVACLGNSPLPATITLEDIVFLLAQVAL